MPAPDHRPACSAALAFGAGGSASGCYGEGWAAPEAGFTWTTGARSVLAIPFDQGGPTDATYFLELRLNPFTVAWRLAAQSIRIVANGAFVAEERLVRTSTIAYRLPPAAIEAAASSGVLTLAFFHPDHARPRDLGAGDDTRPLAFMMYALRILRLPETPPADITVLPPLALPHPAQGLALAVAKASFHPPDMLLRFFESLGQNCEFGLVQRRMGADPLGLLRFAGVDLQDLLDGLAQNFAGLGDTLHVEAMPTARNTAEFMVKDARYRIGFHTFTESSDTTEDEIHARYKEHIAFLRRIFTRRLREAGHIFVYQRPHVILTAEARALHLRLQTLGPNALLFVDQSPDLPSGAVAQLDRGLYHGKLERLAPPDQAGDTDLPGWMSLCINTHRLWQRP